MPDNAITSTRPYLIRALHEWCTDNGFTPYIAAHVDGSVQVPTEFVKDSEIVLNVSYDATSGLRLGNDFIEFKARFGGVARDIMVPIDHVVAIYARENGQGMAFPAPEASPDGAVAAPAAQAASPAPAVQLVLASGDDTSSKTGGKAVLKSTPKPQASRDAQDPAEDSGDDTPPSPPSPPAGTRPSLKLVK